DGDDRVHPDALRRDAADGPDPVVGAARVRVRTRMSAQYNVWIVTGLLARLRLPEGPRRTAALAAWFQGLYPAGRAPVLVGGAAAQLHARSDCAPDDLDFVGDVTPPVAERLRKLGFREDGRRWLLESDRVVLDIPAAGLPDGATCVVLDIDDIRVLVASRDDVPACAGDAIGGSLIIGTA